MAFIDSIYPKEDTAIPLLNPDKLVSLGTYGRTWFVDVYIASSENVKSGILYFINKVNFLGEDITLDKLEQSEEYLTSKMVTEVVLFLSAIGGGAKLIMAGKALFDAGALKLIAGTVGIVMPDGTILKVVSVKGVVIGVVQVAAGVVVAGAGIGIAASVGRNAGSSAWDDYCKLEKLASEVSNTRKWNKGSFDNPADSLEWHYKKHGKEVGANNIDQYLRKAEEFVKNLRGAQKYKVDGVVEGVIRYIKNGKYIDLAPDGTIVSFGRR